MRRSTALLFAIAMVVVRSRSAFAQTPCEDALHDAEKSYELGLFEEVPAKVQPCLGTPTTRSVAVQVHSLLARAYVNSDEPEKARKEVSTLLRIDSTFEADSPARFAALVAQVRSEELTTQVASVSKTNESLREAPATVVVVTGDEIQRRGYLDLEQLLYDLPGFDISRVNGDTYSFTYQRGYRSPLNDRLIFLVDGVEQNDLSTNILYLSRQFPLTNIDRVEVVYGPASTIYGANAYTGVISVITKDAEKLAGENKAFGIIGHVTTGERSHDVDLTAAGRDHSGTVAWSVAGNFQGSTEQNLSGDYWDYTYKNYDYKGLMHLNGSPEERTALCATPSPYIACSADGIDLTAAGEALVRGLDAALVRNEGVGFHDTAKNWSINSKLRLSNMTIGLQSWRVQEGVGSFVRASVIGGSSDWTPRGSAFYVKYSLPLDRVNVNFFSRYLLSSQQRASTEYDYLHNYASGDLSLYSLVSPCVSPGDPQPISCAPASPWLERVHFSSLSSQLRSEISASFTPSEKWAGVTGFEMAKSSIQTTFGQYPSGPGELSTPPIDNPEHIEHTDAALYGQASYRPSRPFKFVLAGRISHNEINNKPGGHGYGTLFTPRAAVIYMPPRTDLVFKAIYSEAFKDPTDFQKFGTVRFVNEYPSLGLRPETVKNTEVSARWERARGTAIEASVYEARYANVVSLAEVPTCAGAGTLGCARYANRDRIRVHGAQITARRKFGPADLWANYFWTTSEQLTPVADSTGTSTETQRTADIASHNGSAGVDVEWSDRWVGTIGLHHSGSRPTGPGTTQSNSPLTQTDAYTTVRAAVTFTYPRFNTSLQIVADNLFNRLYYAPTLEPVFGPPGVPYPGRAIYLRLLYGGSSRQSH